MKTWNRNVPSFPLSVDIHVVALDFQNNHINGKIQIEERRKVHGYVENVTKIASITKLFLNLMFVEVLIERESIKGLVIDVVARLILRKKMVHHTGINILIFLMNTYVPSVKPDCVTNQRENSKLMKNDIII
jgi:hypothetical protein